MRTSGIILLGALVACALPLALAHDGTTGATTVGPNTACDANQNPHDVLGGGVSGTANLFDGHLADCDGDGMPANEFDGDHEFGLGAGFFPAPPYAADPLCDYGLTAHHGPSFVAVADAVPGAVVNFTIGADPTVTYVPNPADPDGFACVSDGAVTPGLDPDDWTQACTNACVATGPAGFDGGYHLWVDMGAAVAVHVSAT